MNLSVLRTLALTGLIAVFATTTACKNPNKPLTPIGGMAGKKDINNPPPQPPVQPSVDNQPPIKLPGDNTDVTSKPIQDTITRNDQGLFPPTPGDMSRFDQDRGFFSKATVYFDFDRSTIKKSETLKIDEVSAYLKGDKNKSLLIEGHCDERGTEEYNRALGERRALALREYLVNSGVNADRIFTLTFGEDHPADPGHNETAWSKNRRGEFILLKPKQ